jgi:hypothetical protein
MFRIRHHFKVSVGGWNAFLESQHALNALARQRGWSEGQVWSLAVGGYDRVVIEIEYEDLAAFERERRESYSDPEFIRLAGHLSELADPAFENHSELWATAERIGRG